MTNYLALNAGGLNYVVEYNPLGELPVGAIKIGHAGSPPYYLDQEGGYYYLDNDVSADGTAFAIIAHYCTLDLRDHTITYNNSTPITVANGSFETGTGAAATGWNFSHAAHAERFAGVYLENTIYDGSYSLKFSSHTGDEYVESTGTITLLADTKYSLSGMIYHDGYVSGSSAYISLVNQGAGDNHTITWTTPNYRGIQLCEVTFTTGSTTEVYKVRCGSVAADTGYIVYIDDVKVQLTQCYGVANSVIGWNMEPYPGLTRSGGASHSVIKNGTIIQGQDSGTWCHGIFTYSTPDTTVDNISITVAGANSSCLSGRDNTSWTITNNTFTSNVTTITSRDQYNGSVLDSVGGTITDNIITNGPHAGIYATQGNSDVSRNTIALKTKYTNAFAILAANGSTISYNTINCHTGLYAARGISLGGNTSGTTKVVHHNTVNVQVLANLQEYGGAPIGGCYGMQIEDGSHTEVYANTITAYAAETEAYAFRANSGLLDINVHDNVFTTIRTGDVRAGAVKFSEVEGTVDTFTFTDNTLISDTSVVGESDGVHDLVLTRCTIDASDGGTFKFVRSYNWTVNELNAVDVIFVDPIYADAAARALCEAGTCVTRGDSVDIYSSFNIKWTITVQCNDAVGSPVSGAAVSVTDKNSNVVYSGTSDANGRCVTTVSEFLTTGTTKVSYSPYEVSATKLASAGTQSFTASQAQTVTVVLT
jgi:hypothetical protein